jgi:hypothetical protein
VDDLAALSPGGLIAAALAAGYRFEAAAADGHGDPVFLAVPPTPFLSRWRRRRARAVGAELARRRGSVGGLLLLRHWAGQPADVSGYDPRPLPAGR